MVGSKYRNLARWSSLNRNAIVLSAILCLTMTLSGRPAVTRAKVPSPKQLIQEGLPRGKTIKNAEVKQLTNAVCRAVKRHRNVAIAIASAAVAARPELAGEITATVLRCQGKVDCNLVGKIVAAAIQPDGVSTTAVTDAAMARAPDCAGMIDRAAHPPKKEASPPPTKTESPPPTPPKADETFDPLEALRLVCDSGSQRVVRASELDEFLRTHPEAVVGTCPPTSSPSPSATIAPATLVPPSTPTRPENSPAPR